MRDRLWIGVLAVVLLIGSGVACGQMVVDAERGFTFQVPAGFHRLDRNPTPDTLYTFATSDPIAGVPQGMVLIQRMHGTIGRAGQIEMPPDAPPTAKMTLGKWHSTDVDVMAATTWVNGVPVAVRCAQLPLAGEAVQVALMERSGQPTPIDQALAKVLDGLAVVGEDPASSGITAAADARGAGQLSAERRGELLGQGLFLMTMTVAALIGLYRKYLRGA